MSMIRTFFLTILAMVFFMSCTSKSDDGPGVKADGFDRSALLSNLADNLIIPALQDLNVKLAALKADKDAFVAEPNQTNLDVLRTSWLAAYKVWQHVEMYDIGKAETILYAFQMNIYPVSTTEVEANIASGMYDLNYVNNNDAVGFPALDYMLYGIANDDVSILNKYTDTKYKTYLSDLVNQMKSLTESVLNDWTTTYKTTFINSTSNTATSAVNKFVNDFIYYYEKGLRATKFGIPSGVFSSEPLSTKVEAFYNKQVSKELALEALNAVQNAFNGKYYNANTSGESFKSYLVYLERNDLVTLINSKFDTARQKIQLLDANFNNQINTDNTKMTDAYDALQLAVVLLKVDLVQAFNVNLDYVDSDGD